MLDFLSRSLIVPAALVFALTLGSTGCDAPAGPAQETPQPAPLPGVSPTPDADPSTPVTGPSSAPLATLSPAPQEAPPEADADSTPAPAPTSEEVEVAAREYAPIKIQYDTIPDNFRGLSKERLAVVTETVKSTRDQLRAFLKRHENAPQACQARVQLAELNLYLRQVIQHDLRQGQKLQPEQIRKLMLHHYADTVTLAKAFLKCATRDDEKRPRALQLMGDAFFYAGQLEGDEQFELAVQAYQRLLREHPDYHDVRRVVLSTGHALVELRDHQRGVPLIRQAIEAGAARDYLPYYYQILWKLELSAGDLEGMKELTEEFTRVAKEKIEGGEELSQRERDAWLRYLCFNGFRAGYCELALGRPGEAGIAFEEGLNRFAYLAGKLGREEKELPQEYNVYRTRISVNQKYLDQYSGNPPKTDLSLIHWVTGKPVTLASSRGKPLVIMVRGYDVEREKKFLQSLDRWAARNPEKATLVCLNWMKGFSNPLGAQAAKSLAEVQELGLTHTDVGIDPTKGARVIYDLGTSIGSGSLLILDGSGNYAFFMQDLREIDDRFVISIIERIHAEGQAAAKDEKKDD